MREQDIQSSEYKEISNLAGKKREIDLRKLPTSKQNYRHEAGEFHTSLHMFDPPCDPQNKQNPHKMRLDKSIHPDLPECTYTRFHVVLQWTKETFMWNVNGIRVKDKK